MAMTSELAELITKYGKEGALAAVKEIEPNVTRLEEVSEKTLSELLGEGISPPSSITKEVSNEAPSLGKTIAGALGLGAAASYSPSKTLPVEATDITLGGKPTTPTNVPDTKSEAKSDAKSLKDALTRPGSYKVVNPNIDPFKFEDPEYVAAIKQYVEGGKKEEERLAENKKITDWGRIASLLGEGLVKYGAASEGLRKGVDLSHIDIAKPNWDELIKEDQAAYDRAKERMDKELAINKDKSDLREKAALREYLSKVDTERSKAAAETARNRDIFETQSRAYEKEADRAKDRDVATTRAMAALQHQYLQGKRLDEKTSKEAAKKFQDLEGAVRTLQTDGSKKNKDAVAKYAGELGIPLEDIDLTIKEASGEGIFNLAEPAKVQGVLDKYRPGGTSPASGIKEPTPEQVAQFSKLHKISPEQAKTILTNRLNR